MTGKKVFQTYWGYLRRYRLLTAISIFCFFAANVQWIITPIFYKRFFDAMSTAPDDRTIVVQTLIKFLLIIAGLAVSRVLIFRVANFIANHLDSRIMSNIVNQSFAYTIGHSYKFFSNVFSGSLIRKITRLAQSYEDISDAIKFQIIPLLVSITGTIIISFNRSPFLAAIISVWIILYLLSGLIYARWIAKYNERSTKLDSEISGALSDAVTNSNNIALFSGAEYEKSILGKLTEQIRLLRRFRWNSYDIMFACQFLLNVAIEMTVLYYAMIFWSKGILTIGDFVLLQALLIALFDNLWGINQVIRRLNDSVSDAKEMVEILETPHEITNAPKAKKLSVSSGEIFFDKVGFNYNETRNVLKDFSLKIKPHEKIAFVGSSGAGKSTIIKLLFRFYDLASGEIKIDGQNIAKATQDSLRDAISMVPQDPLLFHRSIMDNIRYGRRDASDKEVIAAAKKAHCHEFIISLPEGYNTFVGERGVKLSGGERQRVAIARAILKNAPILVLDEATSSLDSESEMLIHDALKKLMKDKTVIVIAHRLSTIMEMDQIAIVENGKIIDAGTHQELLGRVGTYKKLWDIQAGGFIA